MKYIFLSLISCYSAFSQKTTTDTVKSKLLDDVTVQGYRANESTIKQLPDVHQNYIVAGKKNEVISIQNLDAKIKKKRKILFQEF